MVQAPGGSSGLSGHPQALRTPCPLPLPYPCGCLPSLPSFPGCAFVSVSLPHSLPLSPPTSPSARDQGHGTPGEGTRPKPQGIHEGVWPPPLPSPSPCFKTSITIATPCSLRLPCIPPPPPAGRQGPQWVFFQGFKDWDPLALLHVED